MKKNLEFLKELHIAHRGLHNEKNGIPENSLFAFKSAIDNNKPIELDLHILKDGRIVVFHDDNLKRMTGYDKDLNTCTYEEIKNLKLLNTNENIPLFKDVLLMIDGKVLLDIEFKYDNKAGLLEEKACELLDDYKGKFIVKSFSPWSIKWFKDNRPEFIRGQLSYNYKHKKTNAFKKFILKNMLLNFITKPDFIAYDKNSISKSIIRRCKNKNIPLLLWTIKTSKELELAQEYEASIIYEKIKI